MKPGRLLCLVFLFLLGGLPAGHAERISTADAVKAAVLRVDEVRAYATVEANTLALEDQLHDDCRYVHANGRTQTKQEFIAALASGDLHYTVMRYLAVPTVRLFGGDTAIVSGRVHVEATMKGGGSVNQDFVYTAVYVIVDAQWKLASYHSTAAPK
jgi:ketosteroid isomerase-like protein